MSTNLIEQMSGNYQPRPWDKPIPPGPPQSGYEHDIRARLAIPRILNGIPVMGICHNTCDADLEALYAMASLAARRAICVELLETINIVEVGTWCGESAVMIAAAFRDVARRFYPNERITINLFVVDTFEGTATDINQSTVRGYGGSVQLMAEDNLTQLHGPDPECRVEFNVHIIQGSSTQVAAEFAQHRPSCMTKDGQIEFLYIDAGHAYDEVTADVRAWFPLVRPGCWVAGHDYNQNLFPWLIVAVDQLAQELGHCSPIAMHNTTVWSFRKPGTPKSATTEDTL